MQWFRLVGTAAALLFSIAAGTVGSGAMAQSTLRIGLAEDPDVLDPTLARTYVGRIVFASLCDKLFDIDDLLSVVPQLALSSETSEDGKAVTIKLRRGVKFHDGEPMDAEAVKASLERHMTMQGSFRKPELAAVDRIEVVDASTVRLLLKNPFSPLIAQLADRADLRLAKRTGHGQMPLERELGGFRVERFAVVKLDVGTQLDGHRFAVGGGLVRERELRNDVELRVDVEQLVAERGEDDAPDIGPRKRGIEHVGIFGKPDA